MSRLNPTVSGMDSAGAIPARPLQVEHSAVAIRAPSHPMRRTAAFEGRTARISELLIRRHGRGPGPRAEAEDAVLPQQPHRSTGARGEQRRAGRFLPCQPGASPVSVRRGVSPRAPRGAQAPDAEQRRDDRARARGSETHQKPIRRAQRAVARSKKRSNRREKRVRHLARLRRRTAVRRRHACHQITSGLIRRFDTIAVEDLRIGNMTRAAKGTTAAPGRNVRAKAGLNRSILEQSWGAILDQLVYKAAWAGRRVVTVRAAFTSQDCSACGKRRTKPDGRERWQCENCHKEHDRDVNAAINIHRAGMRALGSKSSGRAAPWARKAADGPPLGPEIQPENPERVNQVRQCPTIGTFPGSCDSDLWPLMRFILSGDTTVCRYETDRQIVGEHVRAAARARRTTETVADG